MNRIVIFSYFEPDLFATLFVKHVCNHLTLDLVLGLLFFQKIVRTRHKERCDLAIVLQVDGRGPRQGVLVQMSKSCPPFQDSEKDKCTP